MVQGYGGNVTRCDASWGRCGVPRIVDVAPIQALVPNGAEAWMAGMVRQGRFPPSGATDLLSTKAESEGKGMTGWAHPSAAKGKATVARRDTGRGRGWKAGPRS
jgi:hypothetical protein